LGWSEERVFLAYRWLAFELEGSVFDISDAISSSLIHRSLLSRAIGKFTKNKWDHLRWFVKHDRPLKLAGLIKERVISNKPSEDVLEVTRERLDSESERKYIARILADICAFRFGEEWKIQAERSSLLANLSLLLDRY